MASLIYPYGPPLLSGSIKVKPEDFRVTEILGFDPSGDGEHLMLYVEKNAVTTLELVDQLAAAAGVRPVDIGYSGLKDKQAVTRQWLSLHLPGCKSIPVFPDAANYRVIEAQWHQRKLRRGAHRANQFQVVVRDLDGDLTALPSVLEQISQLGVANYFGAQRFGVGRDNIDQALKTLCRQRNKRRLSRAKRGLYLSSLRSELFNRMLSQRIAAGSWVTPVSGDLWMLDGSHSIFNAELTPSLARRYAELDIHAAISLYGIGQTRLEGDAKTLEQAVLVEARELAECIESQGVQRAYRANRAVARELDAAVESDHSRLRISVTLDAGVYLTTLLAHFIEVQDRRGYGAEHDSQNTMQGTQ